MARRRAAVREKSANEWKMRRGAGRAVKDNSYIGSPERTRDTNEPILPQSQEPQMNPSVPRVDRARGTRQGKSHVDSHVN